MSTWREVELGELCERVTVGHVGKMADQYVENGVPFLRSQNINPFRINTNGMLRIDDEFHRKLSKSALRSGDVAIIRTGYPGTAAVVPPELDGSNCADLVIVTPSDRLNPHMLAAVLNSSWGRSAVGGHLVGAAQQHFNVGSAKRLVVRLPDRNEQDRIAAVLCVFNDLIETNRLRVEVLEEMARAIYREWFVHFRFPGHEDATFVDSDLGPIPEGWDLGLVGDVLTLQRGFDLPTKSRTPGSVPIVAASGIGGSHNEAKVDGPGVVTGRSGTVGQVFYVSEDYWPLNTALWVKAFHRSNPIHAWFFLEALEIGRFAGGAAVPTLNRNVVHSEPVAVPPQEIVDRFAEVAGPLIDLGLMISSAADEVASLRDLLLPELVTGKIDVSELDLDAVVERAAV